jgi:hypothetical protein
MDEGSISGSTYNSKNSRSISISHRQRRVRFVAHAAMWTIQASATIGAIFSMWTVGGCEFVTRICYDNLDGGGQEVLCESNYDGTSDSPYYSSFGFFTYDAMGQGSNGIIGGACASYPAAGGLAAILPNDGSFDFAYFQTAQICSVSAAFLSVLCALTAYASGVCVTSKMLYSYFAGIMGCYGVILCALQGCTLLALKNDGQATDTDMSNSTTITTRLYMDTTAYASMGAVACFLTVLCSAITLAATICVSTCIDDQEEYVKHHEEEEEDDLEQNYHDNEYDEERDNAAHSPSRDDGEEEISQQMVLYDDRSGSPHLNSHNFSKNESWMDTASQRGTIVY